MQISHGDEMKAAGGLQWREGDTVQSDLLHGAADGTDNYLLTYSAVKKFFSPRHRHNFEQIRVQIRGSLGFARDGEMTDGVFGYFPEGLRYGPQSCDTNGGEDSLTLVMQCGGASGSGYISPATVRGAYDVLRERGSFEGGVFRPNDPGEGPKNFDAFQALWEHVSGRELTYPNPRYSHVIMADSKDFEWVQAQGQPGVSIKAMGSFTECATRMGYVRIDAGAAYTPEKDKRDLFFTLSGRGEIDGQEIRSLTAVEIGYGEAPAIRAAETLTLIHIGLPDLRHLTQEVQGRS